MALTILEGSTFCICDELGDVDEPTVGFFADDTRYLSLLRLRVNGERPLLLSQDKVEYFSACFYLRNPLAGGLGQDVVSIKRERFVGDGMQNRLVAQNHSTGNVAFELALELGSDFADIFAVKDYDFALGDPLRAGAAAAAREVPIRRTPLSRAGSRATGAGRRPSASCGGRSARRRISTSCCREVFAGFPRAESPFPIAYPTAARPQAWAAGTPVVLTQALLGLRPDRRRQLLVTEDDLEIPSWAGRDLRLTDVRVFDRLWDVRLRDGLVSVQEQ